MNHSDKHHNEKVIAFFLQDLDGGGAERAIVSLAGDIANQGYCVDLVVGDADSDYRREVSSSVNVVNFSTRSPLQIFRGLVSYLNSRKPMAIMSALDIPNIMLVIAAKLVGYKGEIVISQRAVVAASLRELGVFHRFVIGTLQRLCFPRADVLISNSHAAAIELRDNLKAPGKKIITIQNAIAVEHINQLAREPLRGKSFIDNRLPLIVSVGSLTKRKDMETLVRAFDMLNTKRKASLVIIGKGPEQHNIETLITNLGLNKAIHLIGFDNNPYKWIALASVFVSSSTEEGFPNVIAEALALGRPVVATDCPGDTAELLEKGRWGRLVPVGNSQRMADAILKTLDDPNPPNGRVRAEEFTPTKVTTAYLNVLLPVNHHATGS